MQTFISHLIVAISTFAVTNIDDLLILSIYFALPNVSVKQIVGAQYLGVSLLILISLGGIFLGKFLDQTSISLLGIIPLLLGIKNMYQLFKTHGQTGEIKTDRPVSFWNIAFVTFANGGDNIGVYTPLFARLSLNIIPLYLTTFLILIGVWCILGFYFVKHEKVKRFFEKWGTIILPFFLIILGLWVLLF